MSKIRFLGLDVHAATIAIAVAEPNGEVRSVGVIPNRVESIRKARAKLGPAKQLKPATKPVRPGMFCTGS
jgi:transposase